MKRIAALAALMIAMIAVPAAAAMASTGGSGPGYGSPGPVQVACHPGLVKQYKFPVRTRAYLRRHLYGEPVPVRVVCPDIAAKPYPVACGPQRLVFDMAAGSGTVIEVSGPVLSPAQEFSYGGGTFTITSVNSGTGGFTAVRDGWRFVNHGTTITDGVGWMGCSA